MQVKEDLYNILGVNRDASPDEIKKAYRSLSKVHHPDKGGDEEMFKKISHAYDILSDSNKKANYDQFGDSNGQQGNPFGGGFNANDIFSQFFGGNQQQNNFRQQKGSDLRVNISLTLEEIYSGVKKTFTYKRNCQCDECKGVGGTEQQTCDQCNGHGVVNNIQRTPFGTFQSTSTCSKCQGSGKIVKNTCKKCSGSGINQKDETIEIDIPKGISDSEMMSMRGKGQYIKNGVHGDLIIIITEKPHDKFKRNGIDLIQKIKLPYEDLVLGNTIDIDTIDKKIRITIKPGSQIGEILRVSGKGLIRDGRIGDMLIELSLDIPTNPSEEYINKINDLKNIR